jgi:hypothetical protein
MTINQTYVSTVVSYRSISVSTRKVVSKLPNFYGIYGDVCIVHERSFHLHSVDTCALRVSSLLRSKVAGK